MDFKRIVIFSGHYGSGKTNIAVNVAHHLKKTRPRVAIADIDIVNPYFRTEDSREELERDGIRLIASPFAGSNVDLPALPDEVYAITDDIGLSAVVDVGGDDRGALALGRWREGLMEEGDWEMLMVVNCFRPLTRDADSALEVMAEIQAAAGMPFTGVVNNSNIGDDTAPRDVLSSDGYAREICRRAGLPLKMTTAKAELIPYLEGKIENHFPLRLQDKIR